MALRIRLRQHGRKNHRVYRIVVSDVCCPRDGSYVDCLGWYDPFAKKETFFINEEKTLNWVKAGALPTDSAKVFLKKGARSAIELMGERTMVKRQKRRDQRRRAAARRKERAAAK